LATLGCKINQYETQVLREYFIQAGFEEVSFREEADLYIVNTCSVTQRADQKSEELIRKAKKNGDLAYLIVTGCYAEAEGNRLKKKFPYIDLIVGNEEKSNIGQIVLERALKNPTPIQRFNGHTRAFVKIEDGCNQFCAYCRIPYVRGDVVRSRPPDDILIEIENLAQNGFKELVLAGVNLGLYGRDLNPQIGLVDLLKKVEYLKEKIRIRLSSLEPHLLSPELIDLMAESPWICPHFHLPLQSGDKEILERMERKYTPHQYKKLVREIRENIPSIAITSDVMVGFPGERESHFNNTYQFLQDLGFSRLHIFRFSPRTGTRAYSMQPKVDEKTKKRRSKLLRDLAKKLSRDFISQFLGKTLRVLVEDKRDPETGLLTGYTDNYIRVLLEGEEELRNKLIKVRLTKVNPAISCKL
ncbi:tRNA (N(6)-L-threonylcarbamoyladenosine(37)-C(2))-methylthiotransferase MtaB, partial [Candidatus Aerophobetes bacterium]